MWLYQEKELSEKPDGYIGFVYLITFPDGRKYIGKKQFTFKGYKQVNKKKKRITKESDWKDYYGSSDYVNEEVLKLGKENIRREILHLCKTKSDESYWETWEIFTRHALLSEEYMNGWVSCKIHKGNVFGKIGIE
jgi:hypothetical protein